MMCARELRGAILPHEHQRTISQFGAGRRVRPDHFFLATFLVDLCGPTPSRQRRGSLARRADSRAATWSHEDAIDATTLRFLLWATDGRSQGTRRAVQLSTFTILLPGLQSDDAVRAVTRYDSTQSIVGHVHGIAFTVCSIRY